MKEYIVDSFHLIRRRDLNRVNALLDKKENLSRVMVAGEEFKATSSSRSELNNYLEHCLSAKFIPWVAVLGLDKVS